MRIRNMLRTVLLVILAAIGTPTAMAECTTNQPSLVDLTLWRAIHYGPFGQPQANWILQSNYTAVQTVNADASIFLSPFNLAGDHIQGRWRVDSAEDDDFIGFVFGFQDTNHFYLFDWKQADQVHPSGAFAERGMSVKVIHANTPLIAQDLYATYPSNTNRVRTLYHTNRTVWADFTDYNFSLQFFPGQFTITVSRDTNVLATIPITDSTYTSGRFGFYNFSQNMVRYAGFTRQVLQQRPIASVQDRSIVEGDSGTDQMTFQVTLSETNCDTTIVDYFVAPGSATAGVDYLPPPPGTLVFQPGETIKTITVTILSDTISESNETFFVTLTNAVRGLILDPRAEGVILDDDDFAVVSIDNVSVTEGNAGPTTAVFPVRLSNPTGRQIDVQYFTMDDTATAGSDYLARTLSTLSIPPGQTTTSINVTVRGDILLENDEAFFVCLTNALGATIANACGLGTILNDDGNSPPAVAIVTPADGGFFTAPPGLVRIEADASDIDGFVEQVDFYVDGGFHQSVTGVPRAIFWTNSVLGQYTLTAVARDNHGARGTSGPVRITMRACDPSLSATPLTNQVRCICDEATFSTAVTSDEAVTYVWKRNDVVLPGETNSVLVVRGLRTEHAGTYTVEVSSPCATVAQSATLTLKGGAAGNTASFTNSSRVTILDNAVASPYPSTIEVDCVPGLIRNVNVTLNGLNHNYPDDADILLVGPTGTALKLMSDAGGATVNKLVDVSLTFSDTALEGLPDSARIMPGEYRPTDYVTGDLFPSPAPASITATNFAPFRGTNANGTWSLFIRDDTAGDAGSIAGGWSVRIEWDSVPAPRLSLPIILPDGRIQMTLFGLRPMTQFIQASTDLVTWDVVLTLPPNGETPLTFEIPLSESYLFYRAVCCP